MTNSIKLDNDLNERIQYLAAARQCSPDWIIREAIHDYVSRAEAKESFKQEAITSWEEHRKTGLHLNNEEVNHWLDNWGTEHESTIPACHD